MQAGRGLSCSKNITYKEIYNQSGASSSQTGGGTRSSINLPRVTEGIGPSAVGGGGGVGVGEGGGGCGLGAGVRALGFAARARAQVYPP
jgi:hypothetical protein